MQMDLAALGCEPSRHSLQTLAPSCDTARRNAEVVREREKERKREDDEEKMWERGDEITARERLKPYPSGHCVHDIISSHSPMPQPSQPIALKEVMSTFNMSQRESEERERERER